MGFERTGSHYVAMQHELRSEESPELSNPRPLVQGFLHALEPRGNAAGAPSPKALMQALDALAAAHRGDREIVAVCRKWRTRLATLRRHALASARREHAVSRQGAPRLGVA